MPNLNWHRRPPRQRPRGEYKKSHCSGQGTIVVSALGLRTAPINDGAAQFHSVGCDVCHTPSLTTGKSSVNALSKKPAGLYSDLLVHRMGNGLADGVSQGNAGGDEFRTAPLWGLGQRIFLLHDGRTHDLLQAIEQHDSPGSEADLVVDAFNSLTASQQQDVLNFLRSL